MLSELEFELTTSLFEVNATTTWLLSEQWSENETKLKQTLVQAEMSDFWNIQFIIKFTNNVMKQFSILQFDKWAKMNLPRWKIT